jgi:hypothetical protein
MKALALKKQLNLKSKDALERWGIYGQESQTSEVQVKLAISEGHYLISLVDPKGVQLQGSYRSDVEVPFGFLEGIYSGDLNMDGKEDVLVLINYGGVGLAAEYTDTIFFLSNKNGFKAYHAMTMGGARKWLVSLGKSHGAGFIFSSLAEANRCLDGLHHNFFVYNLFEIKGDELILNNEMLPDFPAWIQLKNSSNFTPTQLLNEAMKAHIWSEVIKEKPMEWKAMQPTLF